MMVFRKLEQDVIGFDNYVKERGKNWKDFIPEGNPGPELSEQEGIDLYGARLIGRWKSGAPLARCPYRDNQDIFADEEETKKISEDPDRINDFDYLVDDVAGVSANAPSNYYCPFTAHTRKTVPRNLHPYIDKSLLEAGGIVRAGIPYGDEVTKEERDAYDPKKPSPRGLLFVCYASSLDQGFVRQSVEYGNNNYFPTTSFIPTNHGQDPIIGYSPEAPSNGALLHEATSFNNGDQVEIQFQSDEKYLSVSGFVKAKPRDFVRPPAEKYFVTSRGGEYFFMPSIPTLEAWAGAEYGE
ncbi:hypothetical protein FRC12_004593 [Ceratobasidium sp. 428]|nr:hypothetical protein FRC12_004593 [Ceratobasidium sp. 428]